MPFTGSEGKQISAQKARKMIAAHQGSKAHRSLPKARRVKGGFYGKKILLKLLNQPKCVGIRYFHAVNAKKQQALVLVGEDLKGNTLVKLYVNDGPLCPPVCE